MPKVYNFAKNMARKTNKTFKKHFEAFNNRKEVGGGGGGGGGGRAKNTTVQYAPHNEDFEHNSQCNVSLMLACLP